MKFDIITLFPKMFKGPFTESIIKRAQDKGLIDIKLHQLRDYAIDKHKTVDDAPCGGGPGMVLKVDIVDRAIQDIKYRSNRQQAIRTKNENSSQPQTASNNKIRTILLAPSGQKFDQQKAIELSKYDNIILVCGHYEGFDQRIHQHLVDEEISIGDYVLTGGELPAMVMIDAISRMIPGVIKEESAMNESFMAASNSHYEESRSLDISGQAPQSTIPMSSPRRRGSTDRLPRSAKPALAMTENINSMVIYDYPVYTRPIKYKGWRVPEVLLSGDHKKIDEWREEKQRGAG